MPVRDDMANGHGIAHGGFIFALADSAFAFACNSYNERTVAQACDIVFAAPASRRRRARGQRDRAAPVRPQRHLRHPSQRARRSTR